MLCNYLILVRKGLSVMLQIGMKKRLDGWPRTFQNVPL